MIDTCRANEITSNQMKMLVELVDVNKISSDKYTKKRGGRIGGMEQAIHPSYSASFLRVFDTAKERSEVSKTDSGIPDFQRRNKLHIRTSFQISKAN